MNVNMTLVIQGINFFCTYLIVRAFLLKPIVAMIYQEKAQQQALDLSIDTRIKKVKEHEQELQDHWRQFQLVNKNKMPLSDDEHIFKGIKPPILYPAFSADAIRNYVTDIVTVTTKKVKDVRW